MLKLSFRFLFPVKHWAVTQRCKSFFPLLPLPVKDWALTQRCKSFFPFFFLSGLGFYTALQVLFFFFLFLSRTGLLHSVASPFFPSSSCQGLGFYTALQVLFFFFFLSRIGFLHSAASPVAMCEKVVTVSALDVINTIKDRY